MLVKFLAFAGLKDVLGYGQKELLLESKATVADLVLWLVSNHPEVSPLQSSLRAAVNQEFVPLETVLGEGDEVALFTPVGGG